MGVNDGGVVELLWNLRERPTRGPKPSVTVEAIAQTAVGIADGLDGVSMQRVAAGLGLTRMALYRYVAGKDRLVAVMIEEAVGEPPDLTADRGGWRGRLETYARLPWETWDRHPWLPGATVGPRVTCPREVGWVERALQALAGTGLDGPAQMNAVQLLSGHIRNTQAGNAHGSFPWNADHRLAPLLADQLRRYRDHHPAVTAAVDAVTESDARDFGLRVHPRRYRGSSPRCRGRARPDQEPASGH